MQSSICSANPKSNRIETLLRLLGLLYPTGQCVKELSSAKSVLQKLNGVSLSDVNSSEDLLCLLTKHYRKVCNGSPPNCNKCLMQKFCNYWRRKQQRSNGKRVPFIDLFAGAGGLSLGLESHGFRPVMAVDFDKSSSETYLFNRPFMKEPQFVIDDIENCTDFPEIPLVIGGPPCQGFSNANRQGLADDPRNHLYRSFVLAVKKARAKVCLLENVSGMLKYRSAIQKDFRKIGFKVEPCSFNTKDYGYPQNRNRIFWFGMRTKSDSVFQMFFSLFKEHAFESINGRVSFTLDDAIQDLTPLVAKTKRNATDAENEKWGYTVNDPRVFNSKYSRLINGGKLKSFLYNHKTKYNNSRDISIYKKLKPGERSDAKSIRDIMPYASRKHIFKDKFYKLKGKNVSKAITAHMYYDCHMYIHPYQARGLTPREAARIQGFPDDYYFFGYPNEWYRQIGNAVSPLAAVHVGKGMSEVFNRIGD